MVDKASKVEAWVADRAYKEPVSWYKRTSRPVVEVGKAVGVDDRSRSPSVDKEAGNTVGRADKAVGKPNFESLLS